MIFPVWPICRSFGRMPASTAALEAPTAAPSASASRFTSSNPSALAAARPAATTRRAVSRRGRCDSALETPTTRVWVGTGTSASEQTSIGAVILGVPAGRPIRRAAYRRDDRAIGNRLDRDDHVAGVHGTPEPIRSFDGHDVADLSDAEQRRGARHQILAESARRAE